jgi:hypothetical protein
VADLQAHYESFASLFASRRAATTDKTEFRKGTAARVAGRNVDAPFRPVPGLPILCQAARESAQSQGLNADLQLGQQEIRATTATDTDW